MATKPLSFLLESTPERFLSFAVGSHLALERGDHVLVVQDGTDRF
jgi:hypothetical protein